MIQKNILYFLFTLVFLMSCSDDKGPEPFNLYGGINRDSDYGTETFYRQTFNVRSIETLDSSGAVAAPLGLENSEIVVATQNGNVLLINTQKSLWEYFLGEGAFVASGMAADKNKNVYAITNSGILHSISYTDGSLRWSKELFSSEDSVERFSDLLALDDGVVVASESGRILKIDTTGIVQWERKNSLSPTPTFAADTSGNIVIPLTHNKYGVTDSLIYIDKKGKLVWSKPFEDLRLIRGATVFEDRFYIAGIRKDVESSLSMIYGINSKGKIFWEKEFPVMPRYLSISSEGTLFVAGFQAGLGSSYSSVFAFDKEGELLWNIPFNGGTVAAPVLISGDMAALVLSTNEAPGIFIIDIERGILNNEISLGEAPILYLQPTVLEDGEITFVGYHKFQIIEITENPFRKMIP